MPSATAADPRAWRADTIDPPDSLYYPLSEPALAALETCLRDGRREGQPLAPLERHLEGPRAERVAGPRPVLLAAGDQLPAAEQRQADRRPHGLASAEQDAGPTAALDVYRDTVDPGLGRELYDRDQWLPDLVRLALAAGDEDLADAAVAAARRGTAVDRPGPARPAEPGPLR